MNKSSKVCFLNSNNGKGILAFGEGDSLRLDSNDGLEQMDHFIHQHKNAYVFVYLSYDLKNKIENLQSKNKDSTHFPSAILWCPVNVVDINNDSVKYLQGSKQDDHIEFIDSFLHREQHEPTDSQCIKFKPRTTKQEYLNVVADLKEHIQRGDIYEVNYCHEYISQNVDLKNDMDTYFKLNNITKTPFSSFINFDEFTVFSCSPERFIKRTGQKLMAQPIKGTSRRGINAEEDEILKTRLKNDPKERAENIMIVDLMRNDLSKVAMRDTVQVDELCEIYSFETVHQMISTVSCELAENYSFSDIIKATFPMGSMTGAPKISSMKLIEKYEDFKRGLYSGSIGYISPTGDFDFNVVIRTMIFNDQKKTISCSVGSAITIQSDPESEYEECLLKIKKMIDVLN